MRRKRKKGIPKIDDQDLFRAFGVEEKVPVFAEELDNNLAGQKLEKIIEEKAASLVRTVSKKEKLKKYPPPQEVLDLHGLTGLEAEKKLVDFIRTANILERRTIMVITGKGLHSDGPAVLPGIIENRLKELKASGLIFDFAWDKKQKRKSGAVIVYLQCPG